MATLHGFFDWKTFGDQLNSVSRWFSLRARCDRFISVCIRKNSSVQAGLAGQGILLVSAFSTRGRVSFPISGFQIPVIPDNSRVWVSLEPSSGRVGRLPSLIGIR